MKKFAVLALLLAVVSGSKLSLTQDDEWEDEWAEEYEEEDDLLEEMMLHHEMSQEERKEFHKIMDDNERSLEDVMGLGHDDHHDDWGMP